VRGGLWGLRLGLGFEFYGGRGWRGGRSVGWGVWWEVGSDCFRFLETSEASRCSFSLLFELRQLIPGRTDASYYI